MKKRNFITIDLDHKSAFILKKSLNRLHQLEKKLDQRQDGPLSSEQYRRCKPFYGLDFVDLF